MLTNTAAPAAIATEIDRIIRADGGRLLSCLVVILRDFQLAEIQRTRDIVKTAGIPVE